MIEIVYEIECHCGGTATSTTLHMDQPEEDGRIHLDLEMVASQVYLDCGKCGCRIGTGDLDVMFGDSQCSDGEDEDDLEDEEGAS